MPLVCNVQMGDHRFFFYKHKNRPLRVSTCLSDANDATGTRLGQTQTPLNSGD